MGDEVGAQVRILLVGLMAVGKTTAGRTLARRLGCSFLDNDVLLAQHTGRTLQQLAASGIEGLHAAEAATLVWLLRTPPPWVASAAASTVLNPTAVKALRASAVTTVWMRARPATLAAHAGGGSGRPLLQPDPLAAFTAMVEERAAAFAGIADITVDVDDRDVADIVDQICMAVAKSS